MAIVITVAALAFAVVIVIVVAIAHRKGDINPLEQNNKPEPSRKHDYIFRKHKTSHHGTHPHIVYDKYTDKKGKKRFKAVAVSHEWKSRKGRNPLELKKGVNPENRKEKAFVIHEIVDDDAEKFRKSRKYINYSVHLTDRRRLKRTIDKWEREPEDFREPFPKDKRTREIIRRQKEDAKQKAVIKKQEKEGENTKKGT